MELQMLGMLNLLSAIMGQQIVRTTGRSTATDYSFDETLKKAVSNNVREAYPKEDVTTVIGSKQDKETIRDSERSNLLFQSILAGSYQRELFFGALMNPSIWQ